MHVIKPRSQRDWLKLGPRIGLNSSNRRRNKFEPEEKLASLHPGGREACENTGRRTKIKFCLIHLPAPAVQRPHAYPSAPSQHNTDSHTRPATTPQSHYTHSYNTYPSLSAHETRPIPASVAPDNWTDRYKGRGSDHVHIDMSRLRPLALLLKRTRIRSLYGSRRCRRRMTGFRLIR
jgi:hypothetical protein